MRRAAGGGQLRIINDELRIGAAVALPTIRHSRLSTIRHSCRPAIRPSFPRKRESTPRHSGTPAPGFRPPPPSFRRRPESRTRAGRKPNCGRCKGAFLPHPTLSRWERASGCRLIVFPPFAARNPSSFPPPSVIPAKSGIHTSPSGYARPHRHSGAGRNPEPRLRRCGVIPPLLVITPPDGYWFHGRWAGRSPAGDAARPTATPAAAWPVG